MPALRDMVTAVERSDRDGSAAAYNKKRDASTGDGDRYEERVLALVFLRCLRRGLIFELSANNADAGKFDDVVLVWRYEEQPEAQILCVQLKHKKSHTYEITSPTWLSGELKHKASHTNEITSRMWLSRHPKSDFGLRMYCTSYAEISESRQTDKFTAVLLTNAHPDKASLKMFEIQDATSFPGMDLLRTGGELYKLNPNNHKVPKEGKENSGFMEHFHVLCNQKNSSEIMNEIRVELEALLGAGALCGSLCESLCKDIREWMNKESMCLTSDWSKWQALVDEYIRKYVPESRAVTTRLEYCSVAGVWDYMERQNPAWVRPPERGTEALSATKIHQALAGQTHIMVSVERFEALQHQILRCWGPFCRWLVIVDVDKDDNPDILDKLVRQIQTGRHLVIVSSRENNGFVDTCHDTCRSSDVSDDSWNKFLNVSVRLNGEGYECCLRDLVAGVSGLRSLLDGQPSLLLALARLSQPLRIGQELKPVPTYYLPRKLVNRRMLPADFFSSLGFPAVCIANSAYYELLKCEIGSHSLTSFEELDSWIISPSKFEWPLFVLADNLESILENIRKWAIFNFYVLQISDAGWKILHFSGQSYRSLDYPKEQEREQLEVLDSSSKYVIVEGRPGVGKTVMLSHLAEQIKERNSSCWVLRVNLSEFYTVLHDSDSDGSAVEGILKQTVRNKDDLGGLELALLRHNLRDSPRVVCLVDGFDEVCPDYRDKCLRLLLQLAPHPRGKLLVTTRPAPLEHLEEKLRVLAHSLKPFSESELEGFFRGYPSKRMLPRNENLRDLLRIPLFAKMFADLPQDVAETRNIVTLYEAFFENEFLRFFKEKWGDNLKAPGKWKNVKEEQKRHEEKLMLLAASVLLRSSDIPAVSSSDEDYFMKAGIVYGFADGKPIFQHRSYAEHFLAKWFFTGNGEKNRAEVYREAYLNGTLEFFLDSFNHTAVRDRDCPLLEALLDGDERKVKEVLDSDATVSQTDRCGRNALHLLATLEEQRSLPLLRRLCKKAGGDMLSAQDGLLGWTPMRYAAEGGHWFAVKKLLEVGGDLSHLGDFRVGLHDTAELQAVFRRRGYKALYQKVIEVKHPTEKGTAQHMEFAVSLIAANLPRESLSLIAKAAWEEGHTLVCHLLLRAYCSTEEEEIGLWAKVVKMLTNLGFPDSLKNLLIGGQPQDVPLEVFMQRNSIACGPSCATEGDSYLSLHHYAQSGDSNSLRELKNLGADLDERDMFGCTAIHYAAASGNTECIAMLVDMGVDVLAKCYDGSTALHFAARRGHKDSVRLLLERGSDFDALNSDRDTPLDCALNSRSVECVTLLLKEAGLD